MMSNTTNSTSETNSSDYITRDGEEEFIRKITDSLFSDRTQGQKDNPRPFLFFINGVAGIGKHRLVEKIEREIKQKYTTTYGKVNQNKKAEDQKFLISRSFDKINSLENLLELMKDVDDKIEQKPKSHAKNFLKKDKVPEEFSKALSMYRKLKEKLETTPIKGSQVVSSKQKDYTSELSKIGGMLAKGAFLAVTSGNPAIAAIPVADELGKKLAAPAKKEVAAEEEKEALELEKELAETVGVTLGKGVSEIVNTLKDDFLNRHKATMGKEKIQKLLISPLEVLTPKLISSLIYSSRNKPLILIFENYKTLRKYEIDRTTYHQNSLLHTWFYYILESLSKEIINKEQKHNFCLIISSREKLTCKENWKEWKENYRDRFEEYSIPYFDNSRTKEYLDNKLKNIDDDLTDEEAQKNYRKITCGHPKYLDSICEKIIKENKLDDSQINKEITDKFLSSLSPKQKKTIQLVSCSKSLDPKLAENCNENFQTVFPKEKNFPEPDPNFHWFNWLIQRNFVQLTNDRYIFEDLPRTLFRRSLFQDDKELFYQGHQQIAEYFQDKAKNYLPGKPNFAKYRDSEWCEYIGRFLYHACFAQIPGFETQFLYHLFASSYLNQGNVMKHSFWVINQESNLQDHPFLNDTTKKFLSTLKFVATYSWAAFELNSETDYGKYKTKIADTVLLCKSQ